MLLVCDRKDTPGTSWTRLEKREKQRTPCLMHYYMEDTQTASLAAMSAFMAFESELAITNVSTRAEKYTWVDAHLTATRYLLVPRKDRRAIRDYISARTGFSRAQTTRLIAQKRDGGTIRSAPRTQPIFKTHYTPSDIALLAKVDEAHGTISGPATKRILVREYAVFGKKEYERLAGISVSHLYNLRNSVRYAHANISFTMTKRSHKKVSHIGIRKKPRNGGKPGYLRVDSVHQGDMDREKGVYHINLVDEVTQWEVIMTVERIAEGYLDMALAIALEIFPFVILGFHSGNGSEYINETVATLLQKCLIEQTKSRPRRSTDNPLVEGKNCSRVRKEFGSSHIPQRCATIMDTYNRAHLDAYHNFHRPCGFATDIVGAKGKIKKKYDTYLTPFEKLQSLDSWTQYLREGVTKESLETVASAMSDTECAEQKEVAREKLFEDIRRLTATGV